MSETNISHEIVKRNPAQRREAAKKLIDSGLSQRKAAVPLGVSHQTIMRDLVQEDGPERTTPKITDSGDSKPKFKSRAKQRIEQQVATIKILRERHAAMEFERDEALRENMRLEGLLEDACALNSQLVAALNQAKGRQ